VKKIGLDDALAVLTLVRSSIIHFRSALNVHCNRAAIDGRISYSFISTLGN
jgi:hypothetical protein